MEVCQRASQVNPISIVMIIAVKVSSKSKESFLFQKQRNATPVTVNYSTHVQYTQTDTIRQTDGPLVPMVRLVPIEKHPIPMVLLVHMHLIKGT